MFIKRAIGIGMAIAFFGVAFTGLVRAQASSPQSSSRGVTLSPSHREIILGSGLIEAKADISVENNSGKDLTAVVRLVDFEALDDFGGVSLGQVNAPLSSYSLAPWMSLPGGETVFLPKGKTVTIPITIQNRDDLAPGGHYGAAILSITSDSAAEGSKIDFKQELASLMFVKKTGGETYGLELTSMKASGLPAVPQNVTLTFKSTGNVHAIPRGYVEVTDPGGKLVAKGIINPESTLVLPDKTRQFVTIMQSVSDTNKRGTYEITAYYRYDGQEEFSYETITFTRGFSLITIIVGAVFSLLIVLSGYLIVHKKQIRKLRKK